MKKLINNPADYVDEMVEGILLAYPKELKSVGGDLKCMVRANPGTKGKVGIMTGGGSGHLPLFLGYVGDSLLDGVAIGDVFQSPSAKQIAGVTKAIDQGKEIMYLFGNYTGDVINFGMAADRVSAQGIRTKTVVANDDVASSVKGEENKRRGIAGIVFAYKIAGACAQKGAGLDEVARVAQKAVDHTRTMGMAMSPCVIPQVGKPSFTMDDSEMEIGMGIHGEKGINRTKMMSADKTVTLLLDQIFSDYEYKSGDEVSVLVNGLGATPLDELYICYRKVHEILRSRGISIHNVYVGEFATSMEMAGMSVSLLKLDDELKEYLDVPCHSPFFKQI